jgi:hypothetical protein
MRNSQKGRMTITEIKAPKIMNRKDRLTIIFLKHNFSLRIVETTTMNVKKGTKKTAVKW